MIIFWDLDAFHHNYILHWRMRLSSFFSPVSCSTRQLENIEQVYEVGIVVLVENSKYYYHYTRALLYYGIHLHLKHIPAHLGSKWHSLVPNLLHWVLNMLSLKWTYENAFKALVLINTMLAQKQSLLLCEICDSHRWCPCWTSYILWICGWLFWWCRHNLWCDNWDIG